MTFYSYFLHHRPKHSLTLQTVSSLSVPARLSLIQTLSWWKLWGVWRDCVGGSEKSDPSLSAAACFHNNISVIIMNMSLPALASSRAADSYLSGWTSQAPITSELTKAEQQIHNSCRKSGWKKIWTFWYASVTSSDQTSRYFCILWRKKLFRRHFNLLQQQKVTARTSG